jgi:hypothetical protein
MEYQHSSDLHAPAPPTASADYDPTPLDGEGDFPADLDQPYENSFASSARRTDELAEDLIAGIEGGWPPAELSRYLSDLQLQLAEQDVLSEPMAAQYAQGVARALKRAGYSPPQPRQFSKEVMRLRRGGQERRKRQRAEERQADTAGPDGPAVRRFSVVDETAAYPSGLPYDPSTWGLYDDTADGGAGRRLCNCALTVVEEITRHDDLESRKLFKCRLKLPGREACFDIPAADFADNGQLKAALFAAGGPRVQIYGSMELVRTAASAVSPAPAARDTTTNFGWDAEGQAYLVPGGRVTAAGFEAAGEAQALRVDLAAEEQARHLDLRPLDPADLLRARRHVAQDLLALHDRRVTYALLASVGVAVLYRFAEVVGRYDLWLTGLTGCGKTFLAQLFMNFFGDFPLGSGRFTTWASTPNYVQRAGYFFKDALFVVDDYKPEVTYQSQVVRILQNYSDGTGRGRLKVDATTNTTRPIRGLLVSTGEDIPEHSASAVARSVIVQVPQAAKDLARGGRCADERRHYSGVLADFVRHLLANGRTRTFPKLVRALQRRYYRDIAGQQNDVRIASNFALLGAGLVEWALYLRDVWPSWNKDMAWFIGEALPGTRDEMLGLVREQQAGEVFLRVLADLYQHGRVRLADGGGQGDGQVIGKWVGGNACRVATGLALEAVQESLRKQGRPALRVTERGLLDQLRQAGYLLGADGRPLAGNAPPTRNVRVGGQQAKCFTVDLSTLLTGAPAPVPVPLPTPGRNGLPPMPAVARNGPAPSHGSGPACASPPAVQAQAVPSAGGADGATPGRQGGKG